jgi:hypothetical protein
LSGPSDLPWRQPLLNAAKEQETILAALTELTAVADPSSDAFGTAAEKLAQLLDDTLSGRQGDGGASSLPGPQPTIGQQGSHPVRPGQTVTERWRVGALPQERVDRRTSAAASTTAAVRRR